MTAARDTAPGAIPPGATIGILGGGQLGRMTALAAAELGYRCHIYCPEADSPASHVAAAATVAAWDDAAALDAFAAAVDVVTYEFENVPAAAAERLATRVPLRPGPLSLATAQHRVREKTFLNDNGIPTAPWRAVDGPHALAAALGEIGAPAVLKSATMGYDGKGQVRVGAGDDPAAAWAAMGAGEGILEAHVDFGCELSVILARSLDGTTSAFDPVENEHENHILRRTIAPARVSRATAAEAVAIAGRIAAALDLVGLVAVEMFALADGHLLVNEIAPRPHNSGHWTLDACVSSQFEQFVRAVCGLPLGSPERHSDAEMTNLIGDEAGAWARILAEPSAKLHLYGKTEARPGRKMGHVTRLYPLAR